MNDKVGKDVVKFSDIEIEKQKFHSSKNGIHIDRRDTNKLIISEGFTFGKNCSKYFLGYNNNEKLHLCES